MRAVRQRLIGGLVAVLLVGLAACSSADTDDLDDAQDAAGEDVADDTAGGVAEPGGLSTRDPAVQDAVLLTAIDEVLEGTAHADLVDEDPGAFLETAVTLCAALDAGAEPDDVLRDFLTTLRDEGLDFDEGSAYLAGALLGASVTVCCPEHQDAVAEVQP